MHIERHKQFRKALPVPFWASQLEIVIKLLAFKLLSSFDIEVLDHLFEVEELFSFGLVAHGVDHEVEIIEC